MSAVTELVDALTSNVPPLMRQILAPQLTSISDNELLVSVAGVVAQLAATEKVGVQEFIQSGRAAAVLNTMVGAYLPNKKVETLEMAICPKCDHITYKG